VATLPIKPGEHVHIHNIRSNYTASYSLAEAKAAFASARGSVVGSAISPVIKICANPETFRALPDDMDVNAGRILEGEADLDDVGGEIYASVRAVAEGARTKSEALGHTEFILTYKSFEPVGPACLPAAAR